MVCQFLNQVNIFPFCKILNLNNYGDSESIFIVTIK